MMTGGGTGDGAAGGPARHIPVLAPQAVAMLSPQDGGIYVDGTFGAGGYTRMILAAAECTVIGIDRDQSAIARGFALVGEAGGRLRLEQARFSEIADVLAAAGIAQADGIVLDLGVSSMQLDEAERGFSFRFDGPLDMRMGSSDVSVADLLRVVTVRDLATIIRELGEERHAGAVARAIVTARDEAPITTTRQLSQIVERVVRSRPGEIHPATRTFQALRMFVNEELDEIADALAAAERVLRPGGRLAVVTFHSLEDRLVKTFLTERGRVRAPSRHMPLADSAAPTFEILTRKPIVPDESEIAANPRARSAKLRGAARTDAPIPAQAAAPAMPRLPTLAELMGGR